VYVTDHGNHRVQVFDAGGKWLKTIKAPLAAKVMIHGKTGEIWVCSFPSIGVPLKAVNKDKLLLDAARCFSWFTGAYQPSLTRFGPFEQPKQISKSTLPEVQFSNPRGGGQEQIIQVELDSWSKEPRLWVTNRRGGVTKADVVTTGQKVHDIIADQWVSSGVQILAPEGEEWKVQASFAVEAAERIKSLAPPDNGIQRIRANPRNGRVYILEHQGPRKSNRELIECDPATGKVKKVKLPFRAEDFCFDNLGHIYLRTDRAVVRYRFVNWREVPWDYGEALKVGFDGPPAETISALRIPAARPMWFHMGGMAVSIKGRLAVVCPNESKRFKRADRDEQKWKGNVQEDDTNYAPPLYPGRYRFCEIHIWDEHGKVVRQDAVPGLGILDGAFIDKDDNVYTLIQAVRMLDGKPYENGKTGTLVKFDPKKARLWAPGEDKVPVPLTPENTPKAPRELNKFWVQGAEWFYGGAGHCMRATGGCNCWHSRFTLDYFARSFVPETERYSVAVLDTAGNLVTRIGKYGNVDDPGIGLVYPSYVATHTDHRLFVTDQGNARVASIKLGYHAIEKVALKDVPDEAEAKGP
jgi:hypothetical protein